MAVRCGELDLFLAATKDCVIVFLLNQSQQSSASVLVSHSQSWTMSAIYVGTFRCISHAAASADPVDTIIRNKDKDEIE